MNFRHGHNCTDGPLVCVIAGDDAAPEVVHEKFSPPRLVVGSKDER